jgi:hypothetical protein
MTRNTIAAAEILTILHYHITGNPPPHVKDVMKHYYGKLLQVSASQGINPNKGHCNE